MDYFVSSSVYHNINTKWKNDLHLPQVSLAIKGISSKLKKFKIALKHSLLTHSFCSLDEFFSKQ